MDATGEFKDIYFGEIGMCGCGSPKSVKDFIHALMKNQKNYDDGKITHSEMCVMRGEIIRETETDTIFEFVFHVLEHNDLVGHGTSVYSSWLTEKGERFLNLLAENISNEED